VAGRTKRAGSGCDTDYTAKCPECIKRCFRFSTPVAGTCPAHDVITGLASVISISNAMRLPPTLDGAARMIIEIAGTSPAMTVFCVFEL
jgi:hypothetical protein